MSRIPEEHAFFWLCVSLLVPCYMVWAGGTWADIGLWVFIGLGVFWFSYLARER